MPDLEFDIPYRELGFPGVPGRTSNFLMPTVHCLVQLIEPPFFVLTLDEVRSRSLAAHHPLHFCDPRLTFVPSTA